jgi:membrane protein YdbS with pleckstrin-like domain
VAAVLEEVLPSLPSGVLDGPWQPAHPRAIRREMIRATLVGVVLVAGGVAVGPIGAAVGGAAAALNAVRIWLDVVSQGYNVTLGFVVVRRGWLERSTTVLSRDRVQTAEWEQGPLLQWAGLGEVTVSVAGSFVTLPLLDADEAWALAMALARRPDRTGADPRPGPSGGGALGLDHQVEQDEGGGEGQDEDHGQRRV